MQKLINEIVGKSSFVGNDHIVDTIFIGGGTPSVLEISYIAEILDALYANYYIKSDVEITIETNPGTLNSTKLTEYINMGINRLSMGVQSLNEDVLKYLGRIHNEYEVYKNFDDARVAGFENINLDMMFGIPGQSNKIWENDFKDVLKLSPEHISFYSLQVEEGTPVFVDVMEDMVSLPDEITDRRMYHTALDLLAANDYSHYEISNASKPGFESRHNLKYWSMDDYIGVGLGAHSFIDGKRSDNTELLKEYLSAPSIMGMVHSIYENTKSDHMSEYIFLGLRKTSGINLIEFEKVYNKKFMELYQEEVDSLMSRGLLEINGHHLRLTSLGLDLSNQVFMEFV